MLIFSVLTLFPDVVRSGLEHGVLGKAVLNKIIDIEYINIRDFSSNKHKKVDDHPYGGGYGMVMRPEPIYNAYMNILERYKNTQKFCIYMSPQGKKLTQEIAIKLSQNDHIIILCGHYEGVDQRIIENIIDQEISIGDYVLTGGEIPAMVLIDTISRMVSGFFHHKESFENESHFDQTLEFPQYTRPYEFNEKKVPNVLLSGNHRTIKMWREQESLQKTIIRILDN